MEEKILTLVNGIPRLVAKPIKDKKLEEILKKEPKKSKKAPKITKKSPKKEKIHKYKPFDEEVVRKIRLKTGKSINIPKNKKYKDELTVYLNDSKLEAGFDYIYVGDAPRNSICFTFDLEKEDKIRFLVKTTT